MNAQLQRHTLERHLAVVRSRTFEDTLSYDYLEYLWHREFVAVSSSAQPLMPTIVLIAYLLQVHPAVAIVHIELKYVLAVMSAVAVERHKFDELLFASKVADDCSHLILFALDCWLIRFRLPLDWLDVAAIVWSFVVVIRVQRSMAVGIEILIVVDCGRKQWN